MLKVKEMQLVLFGPLYKLTLVDWPPIYTKSARGSFSH